MSKERIMSGLCLLVILLDICFLIAICVLTGCSSAPSQSSCTHYSQYNIYTTSGVCK